MGEVRTEITLKNMYDVRDAARGRIKEDAVRQLTVEAVVDTGAYTMVIDEETCAKLGLDDQGLWMAKLADGYRAKCKLAGPLEIWWKNRRVLCDTIVLPGTPEPLLGAIPLEGLDLIINLNSGLVGKHGDEVVYRV